VEYYFSKIIADSKDEKSLLINWAQNSKNSISTKD